MVVELPKPTPHRFRFRSASSTHPARTGGATAPTAGRCRSARFRTHDTLLTSTAPLGRGDQSDSTRSPDRVLRRSELRRRETNYALHSHRKTSVGRSPNRALRNGGIVSGSRWPARTDRMRPQPRRRRSDTRTRFYIAICDLQAPNAWVLCPLGRVFEDTRVYVARVRGDLDLAPGAGLR